MNINMQPDTLRKLGEITKWFCTNCSVANLDAGVYCESCGEHRESGILKHGFFAPPNLQDLSLLEVGTETTTDKVMDSQVSPSNSSTAIGLDERMLLHSEVEMKSHPHPERPDRLRAIAASLATAGIYPGRCYPIPAREITNKELEMVHSMEHIEAVETTSNAVSCYFTPDTYANKHSAQAARLAAGLCADLASEIVSGRAKNGFALVRPPGHHAGVRQAMGFCLHNNAAVSALAAQAAGAKKVLIVDWDVHHGNGTQEIFEQKKSVLYISLHRHDGRFYPGTGAAYEVGTKGAKGYCVNVPWRQSGVGDNDYIFAFKQVVLPIASDFAPDLTIISAGFDAARGDPLGMCDVTPAGYAQMTHLLNIVSGGKLLVILEGGYNLRSISSSATAVIKVLLGESTGCDLDDPLPSTAGMKTVLDVLKIQKNFWPVLESSFSKLQSQWKMHATKTKNISRVPIFMEVEERMARTLEPTPACSSAKPVEEEEVAEKRSKKKVGACPYSLAPEEPLASPTKKTDSTPAEKNKREERLLKKKAVPCQVPAVAESQPSEMALEKTAPRSLAERKRKVTPPWPPTEKKRKECSQVQTVGQVDEAPTLSLEQNIKETADNQPASESIDVLQNQFALLQEAARGKAEKDKEAELEAMRLELELARSNETNLRQALEDSKKHITDLTHDGTQMFKDLEKHQLLVAQLRSELASYDSITADLRANANDFQELMVAAQSEASATREKLARTQADLASAQEETRLAKLELVRARVETILANHELARLKEAQLKTKSGEFEALLPLFEQHPCFPAYKRRLMAIGVNLFIREARKEIPDLDVAPIWKAFEKYWSKSLDSGTGSHSAVDDFF